MVDSTASYEPGPDGPSFSIVSGDRATADRSMRPTAHPSDGIDGASAEHASALLQMGAAKQEAGNYSEAEDLFRRALEIGERALGSDNPALVPAMTSLASARILAGRLDEAEPLVHRALDVSENEIVQRDPDLAIVLNELARLCLKQSAHALAEPLLLRMYALKRSKGEDHPEVATVLASLATVRQSLGRHESAEQLWRKVLEIRERTLAPNHFALATALENLGEACAARGKIGEALQLLLRAQTIRELTLGEGHQSVRVARDRIADLQLQAEGFLDSAEIETPAIPPERYRLLSADNSVASPPPATRERASPAPRKGTARVVEQSAPKPAIESAPKPAIDRGFTTKAEMAAVLTTPSAIDGGAAAGAATQQGSPAATANYRDVIMSIKQELEDEEEGAAGTARAGDFFATAVAALRQRQKATLIGIGIVALLAAFAGASRAWSDPARADSAAGSTPEATSATPAALMSVAGQPAGLATDVGNAPVTSAAPSIPVANAARLKVGEQRPVAAKKTTERRVDAPAIAIPRMPTLASNFDSVVRARSGSERAVGDGLPLQPALQATGQRLTFDRDDPADAPKRAQLIGQLPTPRYPPQLTDVEGEVRVRFQVDTMGRPVPSSISVVRSSDALFTAATLKVIPGLRFEPARSGGADAKPVTDVVQIGFQFRPAK